MRKNYSEWYRRELSYQAEYSNNSSQSKSGPIANPSGNQFSVKTFCLMLLFLLIAGICGTLTIVFPPLLVPTVLLAKLFPLFLAAFIVFTYAVESHYVALIFFLLCIVISGGILGPVLSIIALNIQNGIFIISSALSAILGMVFMLHNYAFIKDYFNLEKTSLIGTFFVSSVSGLAIILTLTLIFTMPISIFFYMLPVIGFFSFIFTYNVYQLKVGSYTKPLEAAMKSLIEIPHLYVDILVLLGAPFAITKKGGLDWVKHVLFDRIGPVFGVLLVILSLGYLENWLLGPQEKNIICDNIQKIPSVNSISNYNTFALQTSNSNRLKESNQLPKTLQSSKSNQRFFVDPVQVPEYQMPPERNNYYDKFPTERSHPSAPPENIVMSVNN